MIGTSLWSDVSTNERRSVVDQIHKLWQVVLGRRAEVTAAAAFVVIMIAYVQTVMLGPAFFDTAEYQVAPYVLGNMHQTGYPLYGIVGKIFGTLVPIGSFGYRMNLMSSVFLATMAAFLVLLALRYSVTPLVALAAAMAFAFSGNVWLAAEHADPHPLTALIAASLWLLALRWKDTGDRRWLWITAWLSGLGLGAAAILVGEIPAIVLYTVIARPREFFRPVTMLVAALLGVIGVIGIYSYLPIRAMMHAPLNYWNPQTKVNFEMVVFSGGGGIFTLEGLRSIPALLAFYDPQMFAWYGEWFTPAGRIIVFLMAAIGLVSLARRDWRIAVAVFVGVILPVYAAISVPNMDRGRYFMITNWLLFFLAANGAQAALIAPIRKIDRGSIRQSLSILAVAVCLGFSLYVMNTNWNLTLRNDHDAEGFIDGVFKALKPDAIVLSWWGSSTALWYGHYVEGKRPDVTIYDGSDAFPRGWPDLTTAIDLNYGKRPVYAVSWPDEIDRYRKKYQLKKVADLAWFGMTVNEVVGRKDEGAKTTSSHPSTHLQGR
jgi:hypothetical protein